MRKRAALLTVDKGEVFFTRGKAKVKVLVSHDEQRRVLKACHMLVLEFMDVPIQSAAGSYDCRLFTIAFATALALGEKPELFFFDQWNMRAHLRQRFGEWRDKNVSSPPKAESEEVCC